MEMYPEYFYEAFVIGNFDDFKEEPGNVRKGINAAVSAFHMADHYYNYYKKHDMNKIAQFKERPNFLKHLEKRCLSFIDIQSIAIAYKHLYTKTKNQYITVSSAGAIDFMGDDKVQIQTDYSSEETVIYRTKFGEVKPLLPAIEEVISMWDDILRDT